MEFGPRQLSLAASGLDTRTPLTGHSFVILCCDLIKVCWCLLEEVTDTGSSCQALKDVVAPAVSIFRRSFTAERKFNSPDSQTTYSGLLCYDVV